MREEKLLSTCLMDSDSETKHGRQARKQRAIVVALAIEAVLISWLLLWPIFTPGSPPGEVVILPNIPYQGDAVEKPRSATRPARAHRMKFTREIVFESPRARPRIETTATASTGVAPPSIGNEELGIPDGPPGILGATGNTPLPDVSPKPATGPRIIRKSEGVEAGMLIHRVDPLYPPLAKTVRISGTVELRAIIGRDGRVNSVEVLSGSPILARAAKEAVRQWRYRPTLLDGEPVEVETRITVRFVLGQ